MSSVPLKFASPRTELHPSRQPVHDEHRPRDHGSPSFAGGIGVSANAKSRIPSEFRSPVFLDAPTGTEFGCTPGKSFPSPRGLPRSTSPDKASRPQTTS